MHKFVEEYWSRSEFGRDLLKEPGVTEQDLLLLMPNNVKKMHGLPMSRSNGRRKAELKKKRVRRITSVVFSMVSRMIEEILPKKVNEVFSDFASVDDIELGDLYDPGKRDAGNT